MILVVAGTNRPGSQTLRLARVALGRLHALGAADARLLDLGELPPEVAHPASYAERPLGFIPFQDAVSEADGLVVVTPEYNGSFPGVLKLFIDMLSFPESFRGLSVTFVGLAAGPWGAMRSVEQLTQIFQTLRAHVYGNRLLLPRIADHWDGEELKEQTLHRLTAVLEGFVPFAAANARHGK